MASTRVSFACVAPSCALAASSAPAAERDAILRGSAMEQFNDQDIRWPMETALKVLNSPAASLPVEWRNGRTGAGAKFKALGQPRARGYAECCRVRSTTRSKTRKASSSVLPVSKDTGGRWPVVEVEVEVEVG